MTVNSIGPSTYAKRFKRCRTQRGLSLARCNNNRGNCAKGHGDGYW